MGIFTSFFKKNAEKKLADKCLVLCKLQIENDKRLKFCLSKNDWRGAATDSRMILEAISIIEHLNAIHSQKYGFNEFSLMSQDKDLKLLIYSALKNITDEIAEELIDNKAFYQEFVAQMKNDTSEWTLRMAWVISRNHDELKSIENQISG